MDLEFFNSRDIFHRTCMIQEGEEPDENEQVRITFVDAHPSTNSNVKGVILLIHGFPQTSYQFRKVISLLTEAGYRVVAPDYRGAGDSSRPVTMKGYRKTAMATDLHHVVKRHLHIDSPVHIVGHDIGGMIAHAYAVQYPEDTASIIWGECPLPGTTFYDESKKSVQLWHFVFHRITDLPEVLIAGNERAYIKHFYDKLAHNHAGITPADVDFYEKAYSMPGAMRAGINVYRMFNADAKENLEMRERSGKSKVRCLALNGDKSFLATKAKEEVSEFYEKFEVATVADSGHWIAEENPSEFAEKVLAFVNKS